MKKAISLLGAALFASFISLSAQVKYHDASFLPVFGKASDAMENRYERLPDALDSVSRPPVVHLGKHAAGIYLRFKSNSTCIHARWKSTFFEKMHHMADTGVRGLDLYILTDDGWRFAGTAFPSNESQNENKLIRNMERKDREYMLYLSLYDGVSDLEIGVDEDATLEAPEIDSPRAGKQIVMYGTSILQGGCCSRPGMAFTNIIGRKLNREVINLGFSGNGQLDLEIAELMASVENPSVYVLDNVPNCTPEQIREKGEAFFRILRDAHPDVPIIFIDDPYFAHYEFDDKIRNEVDSRNEAEAELFHRLKKAGEKNIWYIQKKHTVGTDNEPFVDGVHYTDLGMMRYADFILPKIKRHMLK